MSKLAETCGKCIKSLTIIFVVVTGGLRQHTSKNYVKILNFDLQFG